MSDGVAVPLDASVLKEPFEINSLSLIVVLPGVVRTFEIFSYGNVTKLSDIVGSMIPLAATNLKVELLATFSVIFPPLAENDPLIS